MTALEFIALDEATPQLRAPGAGDTYVAPRAVNFIDTITGTYLTASQLLATDGSKAIVSLTTATYPSLTELSYVKGVTSAIQTQLDTKAPTASPTFTVSITGSYLTANEILASDGSKNIVSLTTATYPSLTELSYVKGLTSAVQTQINGKLALAGGTMTGALITATAASGLTPFNMPVGTDPSAPADGSLWYTTSGYRVRHSGSTDTLLQATRSQTVTNKSIDLASNTLTGTKAQFDTAVSDGDICFDGDAVTNLTMSTDRLLGRTTASTGAVEEITVGSGLTLSAGSLVATAGAATPTFIATQATTSGTSVSFTSIPQTYKTLLFVFLGVSHDSGAGQSISIELSGSNGSSWTGTAQATAAGTSSAVFYGGLSVSGYILDGGMWISCVTNVAPNETQSASTVDRGAAWRISGGVDAVRFTAGGGSNFDAGAINLYGL